MGDGSWPILSCTFFKLLWISEFPFCYSQWELRQIEGKFDSCTIYEMAHRLVRKETPTLSNTSTSVTEERYFSGKTLMVVQTFSNGTD